MKNLSSTLTFTALLALLPSCAPTSQKLVDYKPAFNITGLQRVEHESNAAIFKRTGAPGLESYHSFLVEPVQIRWTDKSIARLDRAKVNRLRTKFRETLQEELRNAGYKVVNFPGFGVLQISPGISGLEIPNAFLNVATAVAAPVPVSLVVGNVTIEVAFTESVSGRTDTVVITKSQGSRFVNTQPWSSEADVEAAFRQWARGIRHAVDKANGYDKPTSLLP